MLLRDYQVRTIDDARSALRKIKERLAREGVDRGPRLLIQCPTGGGKTVMAAFIAKAYAERGDMVRFLCHRDFLVDQTSKTFEKADIAHSFIAAGKWFNAWEKTHIGMVQTVGNRLRALTSPKCCMWDEAHHISAATWAKVQDAWPEATHIGFSATPIRLDGKGLDQHFDDMVTGPTVLELIEGNHLSDYRFYAPSSPDLTGVAVRMGDYVQGALDAVMAKAAIIGDLVTHYRRHAPGMKAVYFCTSIANSEKTAQAFRDAGFRWVHLDGGNSTWERQQAARMMAAGELDGFCNVDLFGEGFDLAAQAGMDVTVECVGLARPTKSLGLYMQQVGRALRPKDRPAVILDHAGNVKVHGLPDDHREWSLAGVDRKPVRLVECPECGAQLPASTTVCKHCGCEIAARERLSAGLGGRVVEQKEGDLQEVDRAAIRKAKSKEEWAAESFEELVKIGERRGYRRPEEWAAHVWTRREAIMRDREEQKRQQLSFHEKMIAERYGVRT